MKKSNLIYLSIIILLVLIICFCNLTSPKINNKQKLKHSFSYENKKKIQKENSLKINSNSDIQKKRTKINPKIKQIKKVDLIINEEKDSVKVAKIEIELKPNMAKSIFHDFWIAYFEAAYKNKKINMDEGKKIICLFNPKNEQEVLVANSIGSLLKNKEIPPVFSLFGNCGSDAVFAFYKKAGCNFPTSETDLNGFNQILGTYKTPAIFYLWNGNLIKVFEGEGVNKFNSEDLKKTCNEKYIPKRK